jgi:pimeloyl-ACP methyl ester carboxylesterase
MAAWISEQENVWFASADQTRAAHRALGDIPLIVLTHEPFPRSADETQELRDAKNQLWIRLHDHIAAMSTRGKRLTVEGAGHFIQLDQPQAVNAAILEVVSVARDQQ